MLWCGCIIVFSNFTIHIIILSKRKRKCLYFCVYICYNFVLLLPVVVVVAFSSCFITVFPFFVDYNHVLFENFFHFGFSILVLFLFFSSYFLLFLHSKHLHISENQYDVKVSLLHTNRVYNFFFVFILFFENFLSFFLSPTNFTLWTHVCTYIIA